MQANVGSVDRTIRLVAGVALLSLFFLLEGKARYFGLLGIVALLTAAFSFCPLYPLVGVNTCGTKGAK